MKRLRLAAVAQCAPLGALAPPGVAASAHAAERVPFTITEQINFATGASTFTATGPLCPSGTFADDVKVFAPSPRITGVRLVRRVQPADPYPKARRDARQAPAPAATPGNSDLPWRAC